MNYLYIALLFLDVVALALNETSVVIRALLGVCVAMLAFVLGAQAAFSGIIAP